MQAVRCVDVSGVWLMTEKDHDGKSCVKVLVRVGTTWRECIVVPIEEIKSANVKLSTEGLENGCFHEQANAGSIHV